MSELYLKYTDEYDLEKRVLVENQDFYLGRHSENDLAVSSPKLSRTHAKIERYDDVYLLSDCDSSNGTKLNDFKVLEPTKLKDGDVIDLGGGLFLDVEFLTNDIEKEIDPNESVEDIPNEASSIRTTTVAASSMESGEGSPFKLFAIFLIFFSKEALKITIILPMLNNILWKILIISKI